MVSQLHCPDHRALRDLLDGSLPENEQSILTGHLDHCERCQQTLEGLASGADPWPGGTPPPPGPRPALESALRDVMDELKGQADSEATRSRPTPEEEATPDFVALLDRVRPGSRLGDYEVMKVIGRGGMGLVLKAAEPALNRYVAVKVLAPQLASSAAARRRFTREAQAAAAVCHENIVPIHAVNTEAELPYLVMQYIPGISLQERLDHNGPLELEEILRIGLQTASGLAAAHAQGLIHRDIKPANILLENGIQRVRITDFGLARAADDANLTQSGVLAGTPPYMAPEQACGEPLDHRADLFSLGSVLYVMCTGRTPFRAPNALAVLRRVTEDTPRPIREVNPSIPTWLCTIIARLHAKDPEQRFQSAAEVADLLSRCLAHVQSPDRVPLPSIPGVAAAPPNRRRRWEWAAVLLIGLGLTVGVSESAGFTNLRAYFETILRLRTPDGVLEVHIDDPNVKVTVEGTDVVITGAGVQEIRLSPGSYKVHGTKPGAKSVDYPVEIFQNKKRIVTVQLDPDGLPPVAPKAVAPPQALPGVSVSPPPGPTTSAPPQALAPAGKQAPNWSAALAGHTGSVTAARFSPDGKIAITGGADGKVHLSDVATQRQIAVIQASKSAVVGFSVMPDLFAGKPLPVLAVLDADGKLGLYDFTNGTRLSELRLDHKSEAVQFSPDGQRMAVLTAGERVRLWNAKTGQEEALLLTERAGKIHALAFSPDGKVLATGSTDRQVRLWDAATGKEIRALQGREGPVEALAFSPDGRLLATSAPEATIVLWDIQTGKLVIAVTRRPNAAEISAVSFSPQGGMMATGDVRGTVHVFATPPESTKPRPQRIPELTLQAHNARVTALSFSPDCRWLLSGAADGSVRLSGPLDHLSGQTSSGVEIVTDSSASMEQLRNEVDAARAQAKQAQAMYEKLQVELDAARARESTLRQSESQALQQAQRQLYYRQIALAQKEWEAGQPAQVDKALIVAPEQDRGWEWKLLSNLVQKQPDKLLGHADRVMAIAFSPDGRWLASAGADKTIRLWNPASETAAFVPLTTTGAPRCLAFSPDGRLLASGCLDGTLDVWDPASGKSILRQPGVLEEGVLSVAFSPDGAILATGTASGTVVLREMKGMKEVVHIDIRPVVPVVGLAFTRDGKALAVGRKEQGITLFDVRTGREVRPALEAPNYHGGPLAFSPDGKHLAAASAKETVLFDVASGKIIRQLGGHSDVVTGLAFTPDGTRLATASADGSTRLWDLAAGEALLVLKVHKDAVTCVAFSPDGQLMVTGGLDKTLILWDARPKKKTPE